MNCFDLDFFCERILQMLVLRSIKIASTGSNYTFILTRPSNL